MRRLRWADWLCGLATAGLVVALALADEGWSQLGWLTQALSVLAILTGLAVPLAGATREGPSRQLVAQVTMALTGVPAALALLAEGSWPALAAALCMIAGGMVGMHDERSPGIEPRPVERRPAPPAA